MNVCIAILGPTASGKSDFALALAERLGGEILCLDSTTVYRGLDIGTAKPDAAARARVPHHLLDLLEPDRTFSAFDFIERAESAIADTLARNNVPIVVGGTYFYLRALQNGMYPTERVPDEIVEAIEAEFAAEDGQDVARMHVALAAVDPAAASKIHPNDRYRLVRALAIHRHTGKLPSELRPEPTPGSASRLWLKYALALPRHVVTSRIVERTRRILADGLIEETRKLRDAHPDSRALRIIGYAECVRHLAGEWDKRQLENEIVEKTRQLAKRQITWIRSDPEIRFVDSGDLDRICLEYANLRSALGNKGDE